MLKSLPRPLPTKDPLKWPLRGGIVTIAAGFVCEEGILICADTEYTSGGDKMEGAKIFPRDLCGIEFLFTGAGDRALIAMSTDMICDSIEKNDKVLNGMALKARMEAVRKLITNQNQIIYSDYVGRSPTGIAETQLLIGCLSREGNDCECRLFNVGSPTVERIYRYECVGAGAFIGRWLAKIFYYEDCPLDLLKVAALYIVQEAKANVPFCGGGTTIYTLRVKSEKRGRMTLWDDEKISRDVQDAMRNILLLPRDKNYTDAMFEGALEAWITKIRGIRASSMRPENPPFDVLGEGTSIK